MESFALLDSVSVLGFSTIGMMMSVKLTLWVHLFSEVIAKKILSVKYNPLTFTFHICIFMKRAVHAVTFFFFP